VVINNILSASNVDTIALNAIAPLEICSKSKAQSQKRFFFGTKAETLAAMQSLIKTAIVPDLVYFSVSKWIANTSAVLLEISRHFDGVTVIIRSSSQNEDGSMHSQAGAYKSCLNIDSGDPQAVREAVQTVVDSFEGHHEDQVIVMPMLTGVTMSGVIMTHEFDTGAPYYVLNYDDESGKTDTITGGTGINKTVLVHRDFSSGHVDSPRIAELLNLARELEGLCERGTAIDIEFAKTKDGQLYLLQARRITVQENWNRRKARHVGEALYQAEKFYTHHAKSKAHYSGNRTILGQMPDWNPAEMIGTHPKPLAVSLYRHLITDSVWQEARKLMGYQSVPHTHLMVTLGGQPYIDVRASFNSFLPADLPQMTREKLVNSWLDRLDTHPEFHDKVEFEVAQTIIDFNFDDDFLMRYGGVLSQKEYSEYRYALTQLTESNLSMKPNASLPLALGKINQLELLQAKHRELGSAGHLENLSVLLDQCRDLGTRPFSIIARHAFIAETILRSAVSRGALTASRMATFKRSLHTVTTEFTRDFRSAVNKPERRDSFLAKYGHLRPGTYDITSLRYDQREDLFEASANSEQQLENPVFQLTKDEHQALTHLFRASGLIRVNPDEFIEYACLAMTHRERTKFVFTRHLSNILELINTWGESNSLDRDTLAYLTVGDLIDELVSPILNDPELHFQDLIKNRRRELESVNGIRLGYLIRDQRDLYVVPLHRSAPNFVTDQRIEGVPIRINNHTRAAGELKGRIVCIENADPGFDWIFTRGIAALVSKYGGANSHMTIRCAELGLPAAIGVGEQTFEHIATAERVEVDGGAHIIRPIYG
jgi:glutamine kinase